MPSLFDDCPQSKKKSKCDKCICIQLHKRNEGDRFFILIDGFPEFIEATLMCFDKHSCCTTFLISDIVSPMNVFPHGMGKTFTMIVDCKDIKALVPVHN